MKEVVPAALAGERVDRIVAMIAGVSRAAAGDLVAAGAVMVDGVPVTEGKHRLREGQVVELPAGAGAGAGAEPAASPARIRPSGSTSSTPMTT